MTVDDLIAKLQELKVQAGQGADAGKWEVRVGMGYHLMPIEVRTESWVKKEMIVVISS